MSVSHVDSRLYHNMVVGLRSIDLFFREILGRALARLKAVAACHHSHHQYRWRVSPFLAQLRR
jgi:hypothetical protein